jgi:hypothetical protein
VYSAQGDGYGTPTVFPQLQKLWRAHFVAALSMGGRCQTDGGWVWPDGPSHYVEAHSVLLPEDLARVAGRIGGSPSGDGQMPTYDSQGEPDYAFWVAGGQSGTTPARKTLATTGTGQGTFVLIMVRRTGIRWDRWTTNELGHRRYKEIRPLKSVL